MRPVIVKGQKLCQIEKFINNQAFQENVSWEQSHKEALKLMETSFKQLDVFAMDGDYKLMASKAEKPRLVRSKASKGLETLALSNNRKKNYILEDGTSCKFLELLGVMDDKHKVKQKHYNKFRQINKYLEIIDDIYPSLPSTGTLKVVDFGCGKAYLTFALYHYLKVVKGRDVEIVGLDLKSQVINFCNTLVKKLQWNGIGFQVGDIGNYNGTGAHLVVTLHACDTATDLALIHAVNWNSQVILSVPCCQHQLFKQIKDPLHQPMLKHGILKDRLTEYLTDGLRALKLEAAGYNVSLVEFTSLEHTAKNIMIKAVREKKTQKSIEQAQKQYLDLCNFYHVSPEIDKLAVAEVAK